MDSWRGTGAVIAGHHHRGCRADWAVLGRGVDGDMGPDEAVRMNDLVKRAQAAALPDPNDEREVMHAHLLRELAAEIERLRAELKQERTAGRRPLETSHDLVLADRERLRADYALLQAGYNEQAESREKLRAALETIGNADGRLYDWTVRVAREALDD